MSRNANKSNSVKKPYCKVCFDAGKPESEYTSHWVKSLPDRNGKTSVMCPTLLSTECRYCYEHGHTAKFCPVLEKNKKNKEKDDRIASRVAELTTSISKEKVSSVKKTGSAFDALYQDSDSDEEVTVSKIKSPPARENFPVLAAKKVEVKLPKVQTEVKGGWAAIAAKPKEDKFIKQIEEKSLLKMLPQSAQKVQIAQKEQHVDAKPAPWSKDYSKDIYTKSWADWTDSDTDEDDDEVQVENTVMKRETMAPGWSNVVDDDDW